MSRSLPRILTLLATLGLAACDRSPAAPSTPALAGETVADLAQPANTTITLDVGGAEDTWTASGGIEDAGSVLFGRFFLSAFPSPVVGVAHFTTLQTGELGTFTMEFQTILPNGPVPWVLKGETGAYASMQGTGKCTRTPTTTGAFVTCTGQVHSE